MIFGKVAANRYIRRHAYSPAGREEPSAMIQISEPITLEKLLPLIEQLPQVEREQLRKSLETNSTTWREEWETIAAHFHHAFADAQEGEAERDLDAALAAVRRERA